jgi:hypothetical protein
LIVRLLACLWNPVDVGPEGDHRLARSPGGDPGRRYPRYAFGDGESGLPEQPGQVPGGLDLLEAELAEAEDHVHRLLGERGHAVDLRGRFALEPGEPGGIHALGLDGLTD